MRIKIYCSVILLFIVCTNACGQSLNGSALSAKNVPFEKEIIARFNFAGLLDPYDENISFGGEYRFNPHWSTGSDVAYIFRSLYLSESNYSNGFILRPFIRYYPKKDRGGFFEAEIHYKHVSYQITDWIGKDEINGVPSYEEYSTFHYIKNAYGLNIKTGNSANLTRDKRLRLEFYAGLGVRFKNQGADIGDYFRRRGFLVDIYNPNYTTFVVPMGMRIVYKLK